jgi:ABC-2 type transport system permease protein
MTGLLIKDLLNLRRTILSLLGLMVVYGVVFSMMMDGSASFFSSMLAVLFITVTVSSFSYDALARWDRYALSLPVSRRDLVASKYLLAVVMAAMGAIVAFAMGYVMMFFRHTLVVKELLLSTAVSIGVGLLIVSILLPLIFRFGVEKSRLMLVGVVLVPLGLTYLLKLLRIPLPDLSVLATQAWLMPLVGLIILGLSYFISAAIFQRKEL